MKKNAKIHYVCQNCATVYPKWQGKCDACATWNQIEAVTIVHSAKDSVAPHAPQSLDHIPYEEQSRIFCHDQEFNRVLGGGIVPGALTLLGGEPGIGKSTILLQVVVFLTQYKILYISGEESAQQVKLRAHRLGVKSAPHCFILHETLFENILHHIEQLSPQILIIDSIQTLRTGTLSPMGGSIAQIKACTMLVMEQAKQRHMPVFLIGHITKEGDLAGPKVLEHMVDTVLQFEGDRQLSYRLLRTIKNRFGSTDELGIYLMQGHGLESVSNPSALLLSQHDQPMSGVAIGTVLEGNRVLMMETQALVSPTAYGHAQRSATGFDQKRLHMLLAVLEKRAGLRLGVQDVFLNMTGGMRVEDPAMDLAICMALVSAYKGFSLPATVCFFAEVGLSGELRPVHRLEQRIGEAKRLGFDKMYIAKQKTSSKVENKTVFSAYFLEEVIEAIV